MENHLLVALADTMHAREAAYRFRHERGVRPRDTLLPDARLVQGGLCDDLDPLAALITVTDSRSQELVGSVRTNFVDEGPLFLYAELYGVTDLPHGAHFRSTVTSGWVVAWEMRGLAVPTALAGGVYDLIRRERVSFDFLDCRDTERPFFERLGYQRLRTLQHPTRGETHLMMLDVRDAERLYGQSVAG
jgi:hypothetical protein